MELISFVMHRFFNITVSVATIHYDGKTSTLGKRFVSLFMTTALLAVINGVCIANLFGSIIDSSNAHDDDQGPEVGLQCPEGMGKVTVSTGGRLICLQAGQLARFNVTDRYFVPQKRRILSPTTHDMCVCLMCGRPVNRNWS